MKSQVSPEEWALRQDLAALYRLADLAGWSDLIFTHFSARVPGEDMHFLINPYGWLFEEITASSLVKVDVHGQKVDDSPYPVNPAGFAIHAGIHTQCKDAHCIMHLHTHDGTGVSAQEDGLLPISQQAMVVCADLAYYDYGGPGHHSDEGTMMAEAIGDKHFAILRNHGTLTVGRTCADAFIRMHFLEQACSFQIRAQAGRGIWQPNQGVPKVLADISIPALDGPVGELSWPALLRKLDRVDPTYRN
ncbi:MAG: class II aldolase/adducin family protein [Rhizorhabdus sp.]|nr:class II aldolase/adducin family protein [Rhizorhabdus sp.]